jgi:glycine/D-amino acid oxidase-like deaminating enzyme
VCTGYNLIVNLDRAGLKASDFPCRTIVDNFMSSTTLNKEIRIASFGEFNGWSTALNPPVVRDLKLQAGRMYPSLQKQLQAGLVGNNNEENNKALPKGIEVKTGLRPFVSDGRLITGKIHEYHNLHVNVGPGFNGK